MPSPPASAPTMEADNSARPMGSLAAASAMNAATIKMKMIASLTVSTPPLNPTAAPSAAAAGRTASVSAAGRPAPVMPAADRRRALPRRLQIRRDAVFHQLVVAGHAGDDDAFKRVEQAVHLEERAQRGQMAAHPRLQRMALGPEGHVQPPEPGRPLVLRVFPFQHQLDVGAAPQPPLGRIGAFKQRRQSLRVVAPFAVAQPPQRLRRLFQPDGNAL